MEGVVVTHEFAGKRKAQKKKEKKKEKISI
jgi:hypothetical protein